MNGQGFSGHAWRKSSYSGADGGCVEVSDDMSSFIAVRDSKDAHSPILTFLADEWKSFTDQLKGIYFR